MDLEFLSYIFQAVYEAKLQPSQLQNILSLLEEDLDVCTYNETYVDVIASYLHNFYITNSFQVRAAVLRLCSILEILAPQTITEQYYFDYLITQSIEQKPPDPPPKVDDEKLAAFRYVYILLQFRQKLPTSVLRSMASFYYQATHNRDLIMSNFGDAILKCPNIIEVPEICQAIVHYICETGNTAFMSLISFAIENRLPLITRNTFLTPFLQIVSSDSEKNANFLIGFMHTWPGIIYFGIKSNGLSYLINCLNHSPDKVIPILKGILKLDDPNASIAEGYTGLILFTLEQYNFLSILAQVAESNANATNFFNQLIPFIDHATNFRQTSRRSESGINHGDFINRNISFLTQIISSRQRITTINGFVLSDDPSSWNWTNLLTLLTLILPNNASEAASPVANVLYAKLMYFFSCNFLTLPNGKKTNLMSETLIALIAFLSQNHFGVNILKASQQFRRTVHDTIDDLAANVQNPSPQLAIWQAVCTLMCRKDGIDVLQTWLYIDYLSSYGSHFTEPDFAKPVLECISFCPEPEISINVYKSFLNHTDPLIHQVAIEVLKKKRNETPNYVDACFVRLLIPHVKEICQLENPDENVKNSSLNLLGQLLLDSDPNFLEEAAKDDELMNCLQLHSNFIFCIMLSNPNAIHSVDINSVIKWWMNSGLKRYVRIYQKALDCFFTNDYRISYTKEPSIFDNNQLPPHLFSRLILIPEGVQLLKPKVQYLIEKLRNRQSNLTVVQQTSILLAFAHFASLPQTEKVVEELDLVNVLFDLLRTHNSYILHGNLIVTLSKFYRSKYVSEALAKNGWQLFRFGHHSCIIPCHPEMWFPDCAVYQVPTPKVPEIEGFDKLKSVVIKSSSILVSKKARTELVEILKSGSTDVKKPEIAIYTHQLLSMYHFHEESRSMLTAFFRNTPMMKIQKPEGDMAKLAKANTIVYMVNNTTRPLLLLSDIKVPPKTVEQIKSMKPKPTYPEEFLSDEDFQKLFNLSREMFYKQDPKKIASDREQLK